MLKKSKRSEEALSHRFFLSLGRLMVLRLQLMFDIHGDRLFRSGVVEDQIREEELRAGLFIPDVQTEMSADISSRNVIHRLVGRQSAVKQCVEHGADLLQLSDVTDEFRIQVTIGRLFNEDGAGVVHGDGGETFG